MYIIHRNLLFRLLPRVLNSAMDRAVDGVSSNATLESAFLFAVTLGFNQIKITRSLSLSPGR